MYTVAEADGYVEVCAVTTQGQLSSVVGIQFSTMDGTASEQFHIIAFVCLFMCLFVYISLSCKLRKSFV